MKHVYTINDLRQNTLPADARLAVLGYPVSHSASPQMHQAALDALGLDVTYIRLEIEPGGLKEAFSLMRGLGFIGCNVTVPHKLEAMGCCDELSPAVKVLGVVNTVHFTNAKICGDNSDGRGLTQALEEDFKISVRGKNVLVLGAGGGAGKAIATQLNQEMCERLYLSNRTRSKAEMLAEDLNKAGTGTQVFTLGNSAKELEEVAKNVEIIINATSAGMKSDDELPIPGAFISPHHMIYDVIYNPPLTKLLLAAKKNKAKISNGLSMLVHQGAISFEIWTDKKPDTALMRAAIIS